MYKSVNINLTELLKLEDDYWCQIVPMAYLPNKFSRKVAQMFDPAVIMAAKRAADAGEIPEGFNVEDENEKILDLLVDIVLNWNLTTMDGQPVPTPSICRRDGKWELLEEIPSIVLMTIFQEAQKVEDVDIPLVNSVPSSNQPSPESEKATQPGSPGYKDSLTVLEKNQGIAPRATILSDQEDPAVKTLRTIQGVMFEDRYPEEREHPQHTANPKY